MVLFPYKMGWLQRGYQNHWQRPCHLNVGLLWRRPTQRSHSSRWRQPDQQVWRQSSFSNQELAVGEENIMVGRVSLHEMQQDHNEAIRSFGARTRGQATVCKFLLSCSACDAEANHTDQILCDVLIRGIADHDIQLYILGDSNQDMSSWGHLQTDWSKEILKIQPFLTVIASTHTDDYQKLGFHLRRNKDKTRI